LAVLSNLLETTGAAAAVSKKAADRRESAAVVAGYVAEVVTPAKAAAEAVQVEVRGIDAVMESWTEAEWWLTKPAAPTSVQVAAVDRKSVKI
jgi:aconitase B